MSEQRFSASFLEDLNARADIVALVGRRVELKKGGTSMVGLCPFHTEKSPSFTVSATRNTYHCFGCGAHGGPLSFLIEYDGLPFRDAVRDLAGQVGMALPAELQSSAPEVDRGPLYAAMNRAANYFAHGLKHSPQAIKYLKGRGLKGETLRTFRIGYAADEWRGLKEAFPDYESNESLLLAGLVKEKVQEDDGDRKRPRYDTFRGRVTFAVRDTRGRVVAFGGRVLGDGGPKYLNSPESPIFDKSSTLFGLFEARESIRAKKYAVVVEGYMDVVMLSQYGVANAVASMGTAFTRFHLERLFSQTDRVVFCFDGDAAGQAAAWKALQTAVGFIEDKHDVRFMLLPDGLDPDEFVQRDGAHAFDALAQQAPTLSTYLVEQLRRRHNELATAEDRARFANEGAEIAGRITMRARLRRLLLDQIGAEARAPGAFARNAGAIQPLQTSPALWPRLIDAVQVAQASALTQRDVILDLLDLDDTEEAALASALRVIGPGAQDETSTPQGLVARDIVRAAAELICEHREQQLRQDLARQLAAGEISEVEFLQMRQSLGA